MALRDKLRERVEPLLEAGERLESAFLAQTGPSPYLSFLTWLVFFWVKYVVVAVTDRRIAVFSASMVAPAKPKALLTSYPRQELKDPGKGLWGVVELDGVRYWVHRRFRKDVLAPAAVEA
jgi:hypothetical protein